MTNDLTVGLIGVSADGGWARAAHVPAIQALRGLELSAVATRHRDTADAAAAEFDVAKAFGDPAELIADPAIDVVAVAATVTAHHELIVAALRAGKHVLTEWPVAVTVADTEEIAELASTTDRHVAVGLQARTSPAARKARELLSDGAIGRVLYATVHSAGAAFGRVIDDSALPLEDPANGMNLPSILGGHTLDLATWLAGDLTSLSAQTTIQYPVLEVGDPPKPHHRSIADHLLVHGRLAEGGAFAAEIVGGRPANQATFRLEVVGENGTIALTGGGPRGFQAAPLDLVVNGERVEVSGGELGGLPDVVINTAGAYAALRDDVRNGTHIAPGPGDAVKLARLIDDVLTSAARES